MSNLLRNISNRFFNNSDISNTDSSNIFLDIVITALPYDISTNQNFPSANNILNSILYTTDISNITTNNNLLNDRFNNLINSTLNNLLNPSTLDYSNVLIDYSNILIDNSNILIDNSNVLIDFSNNSNSNSNSRFRDIFSNYYNYYNYNYNYNLDFENNNFLQNFINRTLENDKKRYKQVISDTEYKKLKRTKYNKANAEKEYLNTQCPIFCNNFEDNEEIIILPCNHIFSPDGIEKWLSEESNSCPVCRYEFEYKEIKNTDISDNNTSPNSNNIPPNSNNFTSDIDELEEEILLQEILLNSYTTNPDPDSDPDPYPDPYPYLY